MTTPPSASSTPAPPDFPVSSASATPSHNFLIPRTPPPPPTTLFTHPPPQEHEHVCFICLQTSTDTPRATWVHPCPCSLEAHESCMLRWIAETEVAALSSPDGAGAAHLGGGGGRRGRGRGRDSGGVRLKCPACKAPIEVVEPWDGWLAMRDRWVRGYSRVSPFVLVALLTGGGVAGAVWYGYNAASVFAGREAVAGWLRPRGRLSKVAQMFKLWQLSVVGPGLVIMRWLPSLGGVFLMPLSVLYGGLLIAQDDLPTWPPSPQWAMALMPHVHLTYSYLLYDLFGPFERRLNRALRGRPPADDDEEHPQGGAAPAAGAIQEPAAAAAAPARERQQPEGFRGIIDTIVRNFRGWAVGRPPENIAAVGIVVREEYVLDEGGPEGDVVVEVEEGVDDLLIELDRGAAPLENGEPHPMVGNIAAPVEIQPPAPPAGDQDQPAPPNPNANNPPQDDNANDNGGWEVSFYSLVINSLVTSLLFPAISYGMGELIRAVAPRAWVTQPRWRRAPTGLLQQRWGRSLVGGCLFVVLRDALSLYTKYRRVQVKAKRRVKNVPRRTERASEGGRA